LSNIKENLLKKNNYKCFSCGGSISFNNSSIDHIIPLSNGGTNNEDNLALLCNKCNIFKADKILESFNVSPITISAVKLWIHYFIIKPWLTSFSTLILILSLSIFIYFNLNNKISLNELNIDKSFKEQFQELSNTEKSLNNVLLFISNQKLKMVETEKTLNDLYIEKDKLEPIINTDKEAIKALLEYQNVKNQEDVFSERTIGLILGVIGSLFASGIITIGKYFYYKRKVNND
jgi:hypothetical protein